MKQTQFKRVAQPHLPPDQDWVFRGHYCYISPATWVVREFRLSSAVAWKRTIDHITSSNTLPTLSILTGRLAAANRCMSRVARHEPTRDWECDLVERVTAVQQLLNGSGREAAIDRLNEFSEFTAAHQRLDRGW